MPEAKDPVLRTVAICDTQPVTIEGVRAILAQTPDLNLTRSAASLEEASRILFTSRPDIFIIDKAFGIQSILEWISESQDAVQNMGIVVWGISLTEPEALRCLQAGAKGILRKGATPSVLLACLRAVASGSNWMEDLVFREPVRQQRFPHTSLTPRELQILELVETGLKNKEIARELGIQPGTVKIHLKHIFEKTGIRGRYGLALTGFRERSRHTGTAA